MKGIILAGGLGSRISEYTKSIPKPMILHHGFHKYNLLLDMAHPEPNAKNNRQSTSSECVDFRSSAKSGACMYVCMHVCMYACM